MFSKLVTIVAIVACVTAAPQHQEAARYPAGVDPQLCPNFPICDNALLHNPNPHNNHQGYYNAPAPAPYQAPYQEPYHYQQQQYQHQQYQAPAPQWGAPAVQGPSHNHLANSGGDKYPAGVSKESCPNYPFCDNAGGHAQQHVAPLPGYTERLYPAGVSAHECPNFPYCH